MPERVAVIIPTLNAERFIGETLRSAAVQEAVSVEAMLVEGGSTDGTVARARAAFPGLTVLDRPNRGPGEARNLGVAATDAPWIAFLDADDLWEPDKLRAQLELARLRPETGLIFCDVRQFRGSQTVLPSFLATRESYRQAGKEAVGPNQVLLPAPAGALLLQENSILTTSSVLVRREALEEVGGFDPTLRVCEDYDLWLRLLRDAPAGVEERPLVHYRLHGESLSDDQGGMLLGSIAVAERARKRPERYPAGAESALRARAARRHCQLGRQALEIDRAEEARRAFAASLRERWKLRTLGLWAATLLGPTGRNLLRTLKRAVHPRP